MYDIDFSKLYTVERMAHLLNLTKVAIQYRIKQKFINPEAIKGNVHYYNENDFSIIRNFNSVAVNKNKLGPFEVIYVTQTYHIYNSKINYEN